ncbi:MAG: DNA polymerase III subunit epsilon [Zoogloeaceae bacterium]|jgi:DNA polymerase-3 subunit epsilon|nr:DNA polymerase III subunit epsilon [Zoogloeaceae bacterium]
MRQIVLDTETTGLEPRQGHRVIEVGCVELENRRLTGRTLHRYVNPERDIDPGAQEIHGISPEFLEDKPKFAQIARELREFIADAELVIHNAAFDIGFLDMEFALLELSPVRETCAGVIDTLTLARALHPGQRNNLDALCARYQINNAHRTLHGALLDAELLAEVYLAMTRGQESLLMDPPADHERRQHRLLDARDPVRARRASLVVRRATADEESAHLDTLAAIQKESKGNCLWQIRYPSERDGETTVA